jgi:hypothetical protein
VFEQQALYQADTTQVPQSARRIVRGRSLATLAIFVAAMLVALVAPRIGFTLICCALLPYLRPGAPSLRF